MTSDKENAAEEFVEVMGLVLQGDGLSCTAGRIMAMLVLMNRPADLDEIADYLQVSRSGVSTNTRELERMGVIRRTTRPGDRQYYFEMVNDSLSPLLTRHLERMSRAVDTIRRAASTLPENWGKAHERLDRLDRFYSFAIDKTEYLIKEFELSEQEDDAAEDATPPLPEAADGR